MAIEMNEFILLKQIPYSKHALKQASLNMNMNIKLLSAEYYSERIPIFR